MSEVDGQFIKRGMWTNLEQGNVMGKTITADSKTGMIIIAVLAIMSTVGTSHLWSLLLFGYHQFRANGQPSDGLSRQQQAILRTLPPPSSLIAESTKLWWSWRRRNNKVLSRSLLQLLLATFCTVGFIAASISTSFVVNLVDLEVLVRSPSCGHINDSMPVNTMHSSIISVLAVSVPYSQECYRNQIILPARCKAYIHPRIGFTTERVHCPFDAKFGVENGPKSLPAVALDSGLVDVNTAYGLNLPKSDRVSYRRRTTCSVLSLAGHTSVLNASDVPRALRGRDAFPGEELMLMHFGERQTAGEWKNITKLWSLLQTNITVGYGLKGNAYYIALERQGSGNTLTPLAGMRHDDADVAFIFLTATVKYAKPVDDPWFSAHKEMISTDAVTGKDTISYLPDSPMTAMGCIVQHQFCFGTGSGLTCSKLDGLPNSGELAGWEKASPLQQSTLHVLIQTNSLVDLNDATTVRASELVRSDGHMYTDLPSDRWIDEAQGMESFAWASSQVVAADYAIGYGIRSPDVAEWVIKPTSSGDKSLCGSQKMRKTGGVVNVNVFGMAFIIAISLFFAIVDIALLKFLIFLDGFRNAISPRIDRWVQDGVLQLQRRAYEAHGQVTWSNLNKNIPLTESDEILIELPLVSGPLEKTTTSVTPPNASQATPSPAPTLPIQSQSVTPPSSPVSFIQPPPAQDQQAQPQTTHPSLI